VLLLACLFVLHGFVRASDHQVPDFSALFAFAGAIQASCPAGWVTSSREPIRLDAEAVGAEQGVIVAHVVCGTVADSPTVDVQNAIDRYVSSRHEIWWVKAWEVVAPGARSGSVLWTDLVEGAVENLSVVEFALRQEDGGTWSTVTAAYVAVVE
jgi:hypothetical protein